MQYRKGEIRTNPELLQDIARIANGHFYRAVDQKGLEEDLQAILDHMEKTHILDPGRFTRANEEFQPWLLGALVLILFELLLRWTRFREFP
jgi:Ca-activated chloride channel family protein